MKLRKILILIIFFLSTNSHGAIIYDEAVSGDLGTFDTATFNLSGGENSILGSSIWTDSQFADFDGFNIFLNSNQTLLSVEYLILDKNVDSNTFSLETGYNLQTGGHSGTLLDSTTIDILGASTQSMFGAALPLNGLLTLGTTPSHMTKGGPGGSWDYEIRFTVSEVSEPSTLALIGASLFGLGFARRRRQET